ncbi:MAG TPA: hypothetical protein ACFYEH_04450 [Candidatus Brocadiaceae bacterium]
MSLFISSITFFGGFARIFLSCAPDIAASLREKIPILLPSKDLDYHQK